MKLLRAGLLFGLFCLHVSFLSAAQPHDPQVGYIYPPGAQAGQTIDVKLGGFNWTDDLEFFVHDRRVKLEITGKLGPLFQQTPPYFVGSKAYYPPPMPREISARLTLPADFPTGPIHWQVANANGTSEAGVFIVGQHRELLEEETSAGQPIGSLPVTVCGRLEKNEEVDRYAFRAQEDGPITCVLAARRLGGKFHGVLEVLDGTGKKVADAADTRGADVVVTFAAEAGQDYSLNIRELDYRGNRAFVYRLSVSAMPRYVAAVPAAGVRGQARLVDFFMSEFQGGISKLERQRIAVKFPKNGGSAWPLKSPVGLAEPLSLVVSDFEEFVHSGSSAFDVLKLPTGVTGVFHKRGETHRYRLSAKKDEVWSIAARSRTGQFPLDLHLAMFGPDGTQLLENDDLPGSTDAGLHWTAPKDGAYEIVVSDQSGNAGAAAVYRLVVDHPHPSFDLQIPQRLNIQQGEKAELTVKAIRRDGFDGEIKIELEGLPPGVKVPETLTVPAAKSELKISLNSAADVPVAASLVTVIGVAEADGKQLKSVASAQAAGGSLSKTLVATAMKPRIDISPVESDERTVHRGTTHLAPIETKRLHGFDRPFVVRADSYQSFKFRQGLLGADVIVPAGAEQVYYPVFVPDHSETLDAYRMLLIAQADVPDVDGRVRQLISRMPAPDNSIAITVEGGLLKLALDSDQPVVQVRGGRPFDLPVRISCSRKLTSNLRIEVVTADEQQTRLMQRELQVSSGRETITLKVDPPDSFAVGDRTNVLVRAFTTQPAEVPRVDDRAVATSLPAAMLSILKSGRLPVSAELRVRLVSADESR